MNLLKSLILGLAGALGQMTIYLGYTSKNYFINSVMTLAMVWIYTSIECKNESFEGQIVKFKNFNF